MAARPAVSGKAAGRSERAVAALSVRKVKEEERAGHAQGPKQQGGGE